ncbi:hypothetical protein CHUAL_011775 [Chamberlinius hualienensis]
MEHNLKLTNGVEDDYIYDLKLLKDVKWNNDLYGFNPAVSPQFPGENLIIRPLASSDYSKGFPAILKQLTDLGSVNQQQFLDCFHKMKSLKDTYYVTVIEDLSKEEVIGAATLLVEQKFIHSLALKGRIEDVVISNVYRGKQLGKLLVATLIQLAKHVSCYKLSLDCKDQMIKFYDQLGFQLEEGNSNTMVIRF